MFGILSIYLIWNRKFINYSMQQNWQSPWRNIHCMKWNKKCLKITNSLSLESIFCKMSIICDVKQQLCIAVWLRYYFFSVLFRIPTKILKVNFRLNVYACCVFVLSSVCLFVQRNKWRKNIRDTGTDHDKQIPTLNNMAIVVFALWNFKHNFFSISFRIHLVQS